VAEKTLDYFRNKMAVAVVSYSKSNLIESKRTKIYFDKIREAIAEINEIPIEKRTYDLNITLANAYLIVKDTTFALVTLIDIKEEGNDDPAWYRLMGLCFFTGGKLKGEAALKYYNKYMEFVGNKIWDEEQIREVRHIMLLIKK
jgi:hypothetical protein